MCWSLRCTDKACPHCTLRSLGFCWGELIVLLFTAEMDHSAGRQRLVEFYSAIQLPKSAFLSPVTLLINYSPQHRAGRSGCYGNDPAVRSTLGVSCCCVTNLCLLQFVSDTSLESSVLNIRAKCSLYSHSIELISTVCSVFIGGS